MTTRHCQRTLLAGEEGLRIEQCGCGHLHLTVGPITLRLHGCALHALSDLITEARGKLAADEHRNSTHLTLVN